MCHQRRTGWECECDQTQEPFPILESTLVKAKINYESFHELRRGQATIQDVAESSAGIDGWAKAKVDERDAKPVQKGVVANPKHPISDEPVQKGVVANPKHPISDENEAKYFKLPLQPKAGGDDNINFKIPLQPKAGGDDNGNFELPLQPKAGGTRGRSPTRRQGEDRIIEKERESNKISLKPLSQNSTTSTLRTSRSKQLRDRKEAHNALNHRPGTFTDAKFMATIAELDPKVEKDFIDHGKIIGDAPARSEVAVWGHKGSSARKVPASSEIAVWGHKGSSAKSAASYTSSHREHGGEKVVAPNAPKVDNPACN